MELNKLSATEAAMRLARRDITAEALVRACLERIAARDAEVQAWIFLDPDHALTQARTLDSGAVRGPLHGLPIGVKDIFDTCDMPTGHGSPIYKNHQPEMDAACVALSRRAGAVIQGKTVTAELANMHPGPTRNPLNAGHTPGGSSSGSAAAVADFMAPLALGTQTAGSVIRPASYCGVVGYKPTYNSLPRAGVKPGADSLDTVGMFARSVADAALFASALLDRPDLMGPAAAPARIGICRSYEWASAQPETVSAMERAVSRLSAGSRVDELALPPRFQGLLAAQTTVYTFELARSLADEYRRHAEKLSAPLRERCEQGYACDPQAYLEALALGRECRARIADVFADYDVLIAPSAPGEAPVGLRSTGDPVMNGVWTYLHTPCVTVPAGVGPTGLPVGLQVIGGIGDDARTLAAAQWVERQLRVAE
jgi:Asp-tRNA(Asn)/Glu-tRNA(Gln) amidotransferase A subunit family amidase